MIIFAVFFILVATAIFLISLSMDKERIRNNIFERGGRILSIHYKIFGPDWFAEKNDNYYTVTYRDSEGNTHEALCKTNFWGGVFWRDDRIVERARPAEQPVSSNGLYEDPPFHPSREALEAENSRLKEELRRLKSENRK